MSYKYGPSIVTDGLVFYVDAANSKSYDGSAGGTTWTDLVGSNNGTLTNMETNPANAGYTYDSANGGSIVFDGSNDYIDLGDVLDMGTNSVTVVCWVKLTDSSMLSIRTPFSKASSRGLLGRYWFNIQSDISRRGKIRAGFDAGSNNVVIVDGTTDLRDTGWRMITVVWDRLGDLSIYLETTLENNSDISTYSAVNMQSTDSLLIGAYSNGVGVPGDFVWQGNIADTIYYNRALSASEITQNYNALKNRFV